MSHAHEKFSNWTSKKTENGEYVQVLTVGAIDWVIQLVSITTDSKPVVYLEKYLDFETGQFEKDYGELEWSDACNQITYSSGLPIIDDGPWP